MPAACGSDCAGGGSCPSDGFSQFAVRDRATREGRQRLQADRVLTAFSLVEHVRAEHMELPLADVQRIERRLLPVSENCEHVDVGLALCLGVEFAGIRMPGSRLRRVEGDGRWLGLVPALHVRGGLHLDLDPARGSKIVRRPAVPHAADIDSDRARDHVLGENAPGRIRDQIRPTPLPVVEKGEFQFAPPVGEALASLGASTCARSQLSTHVACPTHQVRPSLGPLQVWHQRIVGWGAKKPCSRSAENPTKST